ncbi:MAG TPA: hypothetical protein VK081_10735, partial [Planctomycetota bacterium]|nr:hypothetical protein [Planctomycetota bacterium]
MRSPGHPPLAHAGAFALGIALVGAPAVLARLLAAHAGAAFTVLILTAAALGPGAAAAQVMLRAAGRPRRDDPDGNVAAYALAAALLLPLAWLMATRVRFDPQHLGDDLLQIASLLLVEVVLAAPFFCAGLAAGTALHAYRSRMAGLCAALLFGAACGAFAAPFGVQALGGPAALCALGVVLLLCAACFYASQAVGRVSVWCGGRAIAALAFALLGAAYAVPLARRAGFDVPGAFGREGPAPEAGALSLAADAAGALDPVVLWAALVQAALVGILCVVHPVRRIEVGLADRGTRAVLVAFAAAGLACSALAIGLGERLAGFLGQREHAANAANTVLPGMLAAPFFCAGLAA